MQNCIKNSLKFLQNSAVQFVLLHPPYFDIIKFTNLKQDLSNSQNLEEFLENFKKSCENSLKFLDFGRYFAVIIGDIYKNSEVVPLSFLILNMIKSNFKAKLKGIIIKNIEGNRQNLEVAEFGDIEP